MESEGFYKIVEHSNVTLNRINCSSLFLPYLMRARLILGMLGTTIYPDAYAVHIIDPSKDSEEKYR
ncbi:hypothetical protein BC351_16435 [Paenibacillus ferrarius]|uniref:Uncharacterized protein n=1 Tax=Paenibacillus ferrarius TaxID=1469647 RepID=A0A1V4HQP6_9BACL|nr:hypothetical protein BC351_16435 [Paenibacillus ferrarius]